MASKRQSVNDVREIKNNVMITVGYGSYLNVRAFTINGAQCVLVWLITSVFENTQKTESTKMLLNEIVLLSTLKILNRNKVDQTEKRLSTLKARLMDCQ